MIYQLKITLINSNPDIWRRILVSSEYNLPQLHDVIQIAMGWDNSHLHSFRIDGKLYQEKFDDGLDDQLEPYLDETKFKIKQILKKNSEILYTYDFGDNWKHEIIVEDILQESEFKPPFCVKSAGACPPEDCGGISSYYNSLEILSDPENPEYEEIKEWMEDRCYNRKRSLKDINRELAKL